MNIIFKTCLLLVLYVNCISFMLAVDVNYIYQGANNSNWSVNTNWNPNADPNATNHTVEFSLNGNGVNLDADRTVKQITSSGFSHSIDGAGSNLIFQADSGNAIIANSGGELSFFSQVTLLSDLEISGSSSVTFRRVLSGSSLLIHSSSADLKLDTTSVGYSHTFNGTIRLASTSDSGLLISGSGTDLASGATVQFEQSNQAFVFQINSDAFQSNFANTFQFINTGSGNMKFYNLSANKAIFSGTIQTLDSTRSSVQAFTRDIEFTGSNNYEISGNNDDSKFLLNSANSIKLRDTELHLSNSNALGSNNKNNFTFSSATSGSAAIRTLGNSVIGGSSGARGIISLEGDTSAGTLTIGGMNTGSETGNTDIFSNIKLNSNSTGSNARTMDLHASGSEQITFSGIIFDVSAGMNVSKSGAGTVILSGANTYAGSTSVNAGALFINGSTSSSSSFTVSSGAFIGGSGTLGGNLDLNPGGIISPGSSEHTAGNLTLGGSTFDFRNSTYVWNISDIGGPSDTFDGTAGVHWDLLSFSSLLDLSAALDSSNKMTIQIKNADPSFYQSVFGMPSYSDSPNFSGSGTDFKIMNNVTNFSADYFTLDNTLLNTNWRLVHSGNALWLSYQAVPEPGTYIIGIILVLLVIFRFKKCN